MTQSQLTTKQHQLMRYFLSGSVVFILGHLQYRMIYSLLADTTMRAGASWVVHFIAGTIWSHALHRCFTFQGAPQLPYLISLRRTFVSYLMVLVFSAILLILVCDVAGGDPIMGWGVGTVVSGACNFIILSRWTICGVQKESLHEP